MEEFIVFIIMLKETIDELDIKEDGIYVDCTLGGAGHALYLLNQLNDDGRLIAIDQDTTALENAKEVLKITYTRSRLYIQL